MTVVSDMMTRNVRVLAPSDTVLQAAQAMQELNVGSIPVCEGRKLVGIVTDRDIVLKVVAKSRDGKGTPLSEVMSTPVRTSLEGDDVLQVLEDMGKRQIRRMPVVDAAGALVGIIALGDIAAKATEDESEVGNSLADISAPAKPKR